MKKKTKRLLTSLLVLTMTIGIFSGTALADEKPETGIAVASLKQTSSAYDIGIAADNVRLAWELDADSRGVYQSAYNLVIRDSEETVYDTGWVESSAQSGIKAQNLEPETEYFWTVNVKDQFGNESGFAPEASFETAPDEIKGDWIGPGKLFRREFALSQPVANIDRARSYIGSPSMMEIHLNGEKVGDLVLGPRKPSADAEVYYNTYDILPYLQDGANAIGLMCSSVWSLGDAAKGMIKIWYKDGSTQVISTDTNWRITTDSFITRYSLSSGEDEDARLMAGWDTVGYDDSAWTAYASPVYDGVYHVDANLGVAYTNISVSGDFSIEADMSIGGSAGAIVFGSDTNRPWMWQFHAGRKALRIHDLGTWTNSKTVNNSAIATNNKFRFKIEVTGTSVNTYIDETLVDTTTVTAGTTDGKIGFRTAANEYFTLDNFRVMQEGAVIVDDSFDYLDSSIWKGDQRGQLRPSNTGTVIIDEVAPVNVYDSPAGNQAQDTTKPYTQNGILYLPTNSGMHYSSQSFSGDYTVELEARANKAIALLFGNGSPYPAMWQIHRNSTVRMHAPGSWSDITIENITGVDVTTTFTKFKVEVKGNEVTAVVDDTLNIGKVTLPEGSTSGPIGFRVAAGETMEVKWIKVYQNDKVVFEDNFEYIDTSKWTFPKQPTEKRYILDFGKNMSGYVRVEGKLDAGQTVKLAYAEMVNEDGSIFPNTTRHCPTCTYTFSGGNDVFEPHFFYTGFRYVEVTSNTALPADAFTACFVSDDVPVTGTFESSNERLNAIYDLYYQAQRSNMVSNYTDCPQREKNGWTGDASVTKEAASIILGDYTTAESYMRLMELCIFEDGQPLCILPRVHSDLSLKAEYDTTWAAAYFTFPYNTYLQTGDAYYIEKMYDTLVTIFDFYKEKAGDDYIYPDWRYSDWVGYDRTDGKLNHESLNAVYTYWSGVMLSEMAEAIGKDHTELDEYLANMYDALQTEYNKGTYWAADTQTNNSLALDANVVPEEQRNTIIASTLNNLESYGSLRTGVLGTYSLYNALSAENRHKELLDVTITDKKASFGYMLDNGATTMWEHWDKAGETNHSNVSDMIASHDSQNHCMLGGSAAAWMYEGLAGIRSTGPAYHTITYRPGIESELTYAKASVDTMIGTAESDWSYEDGVLDWKVTVPVNSEAKIIIPVEAETITESGEDILGKNGDGITYVGVEDGAYVYTAGSGTYNFYAVESDSMGDMSQPVDVTFVAGNDYGTVSSTPVAVGKGGKLQILPEHTNDGNVYPAYYVIDGQKYTEKELMDVRFNEDTEVAVMFRMDRIHNYSFDLTKMTAEEYALTPFASENRWTFEEGVGIHLSENGTLKEPVINFYSEDSDTVYELDYDFIQGTGTGTKGHGGFDGFIYAEDDTLVDKLFHTVANFHSCEGTQPIALKNFNTPEGKVVLDNDKIQNVKMIMDRANNKSIIIYNDEVGVGTGDSQTLTNVKAPCSIKLTTTATKAVGKFVFTRISFKSYENKDIPKVSVAAGENVAAVKMGNAVASSNMSEGSKIQVSATVNAPYVFDRWEIAGDGSVENASSATTYFTAGTKDTTVKAVAILPATEYTVTFDLGEHGTTTDETVLTVEEGTVPTAPVVTPNAGYSFIGWDKEIVAATENTTYTAQYEAIDYVAQVGEAKFESLAEAVEAAQDGDTVVLLGDSAGAGVVINKDITIDLGTYTYTFTAGVGSTGTESNGFQILKDNTVEIKNGTLEVAESAKDNFYTVIQNYANLTLTDVTLDGTNLDKWSTTDGDSYVLSNNSGNIELNGNTNIIANNDGDKAFAFDVCKSNYYEAPVVTVNTTGKIAGLIEVTESISDNLTINSGIYTVDVSDYCADGFTAEQNEDGTYGIVEVEEETLPFKDILTTRVQSVKYDETTGQITLGLDRYKFNMTSATYGIALVPHDGETVEIAYNHDNGTAGVTTFKKFSSDKYTSFVTGVNAENGGGEYGKQPLYIIDRANGTRVYLDVTVTKADSTVETYTILVRQDDLAVEGDVDITEILPLRADADSFVLDNEAKTIYYEASTANTSAGFAVAVDNGLNLATRPRRLVTAKSGQNLAHGEIKNDEALQARFDRYVVARLSAGLEQTYQIKVHGGEDGLTYSWYTVTVKFNRVHEGDIEFFELLTKNADTCEFDTETNTINVTYSGASAAVAPVVVNGTRVYIEGGIATTVDGVKAVAVKAENGVEQTAKITLKIGNDTTVYTVNFSYVG